MLWNALLLICVFIVHDVSSEYRGGSDVFKSARHSSTYGTNWANYAVDGDVTTRSHTLCNEPQYMVLTLKQEYNVRIRSVRFINGKLESHFGRINGVTISIQDTNNDVFVCGTVEASYRSGQSAQTYTVACKYGYGNKVVFTQPRNECLELAEVYLDVQEDIHPVIRDISMMQAYPGSNGFMAIDRDYTTETHTKCQGNQYIVARFKKAQPLYEVTIVNGKRNIYYTRLDKTEIYASHNGAWEFCGSIRVTQDLSISGQTYRVSCKGMVAEAVSIALKTNNCLSIAELDVSVGDISRDDDLVRYAFDGSAVSSGGGEEAARRLIDGNPATAASVKCSQGQWMTASFESPTYTVDKLTVVVGSTPGIAYGTKAQVYAYDINDKLISCGQLDTSYPVKQDLYCHVENIHKVEIRSYTCMTIAEIIPWGKTYQAGQSETEIIPSTVFVDQTVRGGTGVEYDADFDRIHDTDFKSGLALRNEEDVSSRHKVYFRFDGDVSVSKAVFYVEEVPEDIQVHVSMETYSDKGASNHDDNEVEFDYMTAAMTTPMTTSPSASQCSPLQHHMLNAHTRILEVVIDCYGISGYGLVLSVLGDKPYEVDLLEVKIYGSVEERNDEVDMGFNAKNMATEYSQMPMYTVTMPTEEPYAPPDDETKDVLLKSNPGVFDETSNDGVIWEPKLTAAVPLKQVEKSKSDILGFLAEGGYLNYVLDDESITSKEQEKQERQKSRGKKTKRDAPVSRSTKRKVVKNGNIKDAIVLLQRFNGFPETGQVSRDVLEFMKGARCGNNDMEFSPELKKEGDGLCSNIIQSRKVDWSSISSVSCGQLAGKGRSMCVSIPSKGAETFVKPTKYFVDVDLFYRGTSAESWRKLTEIFAIYYNFDKSIGASGYGDKVQLFADKDSFGFQYEELTKGKPKIIRLKHSLSKTQLTRREFKIRIDVEDGGRAFLLVDNKDIGVMPYTYPMKSQALIRWALQAPDIITARLCRRPEKKSLSRNRRYAVSLHSWGTNEVTFNFQNYSSSLGEAKTRQGVVDALNVITKRVKIKFIEKNKHEPVMLSYMFIKGKHADGRSFDGAGREKAHAFSPANSEIHFNDWEKFTLEKEERATSLFYVTLHETGHALGLKHSEYRQAVMNAGYNDETAFSLKDFHRDDINALTFQYPGSALGTGEVKPLVQRKTYSWYTYRPKLPLPVECFNRIDAAVALDDTLFLLSNAFLWQYKTSDLSPVGEVRATSQVFPGWNFPVKAAFRITDRVYLLSDEFAARYNHVKTSTGGKFILESAGLINAMILPKKSKEKLPTIKSAFTLANGGEVKTILVVSNTLWYEIKWKNYKKAIAVQKVPDSTGKRLIGRTFNSKEFNAAFVYTRTFAKTKTKSREVLKFDLKFGSSVVPFPKEERKNPGVNIPAVFKIKGWCK